MGREAARLTARLAELGYTQAVGGQDPRQAQPGSRAPGDPVPRFAQPLMLFDAAASALFSTEASAVAFAGQDHSWVAQGDVQHTAAHTASTIAGGTVSWYAHDHGLQFKAAAGALSLRAHTDTLSIHADRQATITSTHDEIHVQAQTRIELTCGSSRIVLDGGDITFTCPGAFTVQAATHQWEGAAKSDAELPNLPAPELAKNWIELSLYGHDGTPMRGIEYELTFADGTKRSAALDGSAQQRAEAVPWGEAKLVYKNKPSATDVPRPGFDELIALTEPLIAEEEQRFASLQGAAQGDA
ncbi:DUF2345 domain-containing protein [Caldimonas manganoxidans]|uniref:DUF2345 domain-containing protein n=1 Tax=Caldimonas manganoxidans TaxID=196015 RepID=UPI00036B72DC|nr:DUF2345 domain-containing protein [Caldimonas manganoxidans]